MTNVRLTATQQEVVNHEDGALLVVAGPGSGKTRVLTERVRRLLEKPHEHFRILALTFTNKAANEMSERLDGIESIAERAFIGTLHSFCIEVLANRGKSVGIDGLPHIFETYGDRKQILHDAVMGDPDLSSELKHVGDAKAQSQRLDQWLKSIAEAKSHLLIEELIEDESVRRLYEIYNQALRACGAIDYDDILLLAYRLFEERPAVASFYKRQYRYICIDESQDLNEAQYRVITSLCGKDFLNVMMVGDPKQAIYSWIGADPKYVEMFERNFKAKRIDLKENFRSSQMVIAAARTLNTGYSPQEVFPIVGSVTITRCADEEQEAEHVISTVEELIKHGHPDVEGEITLERCAILGRNKFVFSAVESLLREREIAFTKRMATGSVDSASDIVGEYELALRVVANPLDRLHLGILAKRWNYGRSVEEIYQDRDLRSVTGKEILEHLHAEATGGFADVVCRAIGESQWDPLNFKLTRGLKELETASLTMDDDQRRLVLEDIKEWQKNWNYFVRSDQGGSYSIGTFLSQKALGSTQQPSHDGIALLTVHSAKGMEFDVVFVIGMIERTFPDYRAVGHSLEEEQRNAFVAVTRSRRLLYLSYPHEKLMPWGDMKVQAPSRFVNMISDGLGVKHEIIG